MKKVHQIQKRSKNKKKRYSIDEKELKWKEGEGCIAMIQALIPLGLKAVEESLQEEVLQLVGEKYSRESTGNSRWGSNPGSVYLGDQKVSIRVPRVRDRNQKQEVSLKNYEALQKPKVIDELSFARIINGLSCRKYEKAALSVPETFGISKSSVSKKFIRSSAKKLKDLNERELGDLDITAVFLDGKSMASAQMMIALGVTMQGEKVILGFLETSTENYRVCKEFLHSLEARGLKTEQGILFIIDGAKGIRKALEEVYGKEVVVQRCQWHKRENVVSYLSKGIRSEYRKKLQQAYEEPSYEGAKRKLRKIQKELQLINQSAVVSLQEGMEETLTLHRLGLQEKLGISLKTTNCIESLNSQIEQYTGRIRCWKNSDPRHRWLASALLEIEPRLRKIKGYRHLKQLREAMKYGNKMAVKSA